MKYLLDTHTLLWYLDDDANLSQRAKQLITDPSNEIAINIGSFWEIAIKNSVGKLNLTRQIRQIFAEARTLQIEISSVNESLILLVNTLPLHHRDPFDRLFICQCLHENIPILSRDSAFDAYGVMRIWS